MRERERERRDGEEGNKWIQNLVTTSGGKRQEGRARCGRALL
jgi:hypothetical protein